MPMKTKYANPVIPDVNRWMPWCLLRAIHRATPTCWVKMVAWRMFGSEGWWQEPKICAIGADGYCSCGKRKGTPE